MKRKLTAVLAGLMILCMGTTVFAADSPESADAIAERLSENVEDIKCSEDIDITFDKVDGETATKATEEAVAQDSSGEVLALVEVSANGKDISKGITLTFYVSGVSKGDNIYILHYVNGTWEVIKPIVGNGWVKATFYSLSPIAIVNYDPGVTLETTKHDNGDDDTDDGSKKDDDKKDKKDKKHKDSKKKSSGSKRSKASTSPKTGESFPVLPLLAVLALMGIVVCGKKAHRL